LPKQLSQIYEISRRLERYQLPDYDLFIALLGQAMREAGCSWDDPYDWAKLSQWRLRSLSKISLVPPEGDRPDVPPDVEVPEIGPFEAMDEEADQEEGDTAPEKPSCAVF
jgi:hypothetical protein